MAHGCEGSLMEDGLRVPGAVSNKGLSSSPRVPEDSVLMCLEGMPVTLMETLLYFSAFFLSFLSYQTSWLW